MGGYRLWVAFEDGVAGEIDLQPHLEFEGVFEPLADLRYFSKVRVSSDTGTIVWPNDSDIDPVVLYSWVTNRRVEDVLAAPGPLKHRRKN
jgi:hypothetical protein